jgi:hypothetical protein
VSRLDSFIRRMQAQRDCLNVAAALIADVPGAVFDLGLGNGRTFDYLREILPDREIFVFDRVVNANPKSRPTTRTRSSARRPTSSPRSRRASPAAWRWCIPTSGPARPRTRR